MLKFNTDIAVVELVWFNSFKLFPAHSNERVAFGFPPESWQVMWTFAPLMYGIPGEEGYIAGAKEGGSEK